MSSPTMADTSGLVISTRKWNGWSLYERQWTHQSKPPLAGHGRKDIGPGLLRLDMVEFESCLRLSSENLHIPITIAEVCTRLCGAL